MTDIVISEVYAACERLKTKTVSNIKFGVLYNRRDIELLPMCNLLYSALSLLLTQATILAQVLNLLLAKVRPEGMALLRAPTQHRLYRFMLPGAETANELNIIPQWKIFELLRVQWLLACPRPGKLPSPRLRRFVYEGLGSNVAVKAHVQADLC